MPQTLDKPTTTVEERPVEAPVRAKPEVAPVPPWFVRWLGWLLVAMIILGGAGLIWYSVATDTTEAPTAIELTAPPLAEINLYENPELKVAESFRLIPPALETIDPHDNPESRWAAPSVIIPTDPEAEARIP